MTTWTPPALASEARAYAQLLWRVVEAQHTASTMRLVDSLEEQGTLEGILEASKPALPQQVRALHYLLATPFRYRPHAGSRFRGAFEAGVWYGAEQLRTALAEKSYWRLRFLLDSPGTPDLKPVPHTAFRAQVRSRRADLTGEPFVQRAADLCATQGAGHCGKGRDRADPIRVRATRSRGRALRCLSLPCSGVPGRAPSRAGSSLPRDGRCAVDMYA